MNVATLIISAALLLGIVGVSVYGAAALPAGAQLPLHFGPAGYTNWQQKTFGLVLWPATAVVVYVVLIVSGRNQHDTGSHGLSLPVGLTIALALILVNYVGAARAALSRSRVGTPGRLS
jgi:hypothetical protein